LKKNNQAAGPPVPTEARPPRYLSIQLLFSFINIKTLNLHADRGGVASLLLDYQSLPYFEIILNVALYNSKAAVLPVPTLLAFAEK